jgi:hypothetical protein
MASLIGVRGMGGILLDAFGEGGKGVIVDVKGLILVCWRICETWKWENYIAASVISLRPETGILRSVGI